MIDLKLKLIFEYFRIFKIERNIFIKIKYILKFQNLTIII